MDKATLKKGLSIAVALLTFFAVRALLQSDGSRTTTTSMSTATTATASKKTNPSARRRSPSSSTTSRQASPVRESPAEGGEQQVARLYAAKKSDVFVLVRGAVDKILPDDNEGSRHQRFILKLGDGRTLLVAHNIDLAKRVPFKRGDRLRLRGEYEWNERGGVLHFTHRPSRGSGQGGFIEHNGVRYD